MKNTFVALVGITVLLLVLTAPSFAGSGSSLHGTYVGTGSGSALFALCGFNDKGIPNQAAQGAYSTLLTNTEGRWVFHPDGTGSLQVRIDVISLANSVFPVAPGTDALRFPWVGENQAKAKFSYNFDPNSGTLDITITNSNQEWTTGPLAGVTASLQAPFSIGGAIVSQDRKSIKLHTHNEVRTLPLSIPNCASGTQAQIAEQLSSILLRQDQAPQLLK